MRRAMAARARAGRTSAWTLLPLLAVGIGSSAAPAAANRQIDEPAGTLEQIEEDVQRARSYGELVQVRLYGGSEFVIGSDFGEFDATSYQPEGRLKVTLPVARNAAIRVIARGSALLYEFDDVSTNLFGTPTSSDPFDDLYATSLQLQGGFRPGWRGLFSDEERWSLVADAFARARWERGASFTSSLTGGGAFGVGYQIGDWFEVLVGGAASTRLLDDKVVFRPLFEIDWRFADRWRLRTRGVGAQLEYDLDEGLTLFVSGRRQSQSFLLDDRGAPVGEGRLRRRSFPVSLGARWDAGDHLDVTLVAGAMLKQELRSQDEDREDVGHVRAGPAPFVGLTFQLRPDARRKKPAPAEGQRLP